MGRDKQNYKRKLTYRLILFNITYLWNISHHSEYFKKWLRALDATWQPISGDLTAHAGTDTLPSGKLVYDIIKSYTMPEQVDLGAKYCIIKDSNQIICKQ